MVVTTAAQYRSKRELGSSTTERAHRGSLKVGHFSFGFGRGPKPRELFVVGVSNSLYGAGAFFGAFTWDLLLHPSRDNIAFKVATAAWAATWGVRPTQTLDTVEEVPLHPN